MAIRPDDSRARDEAEAPAAPGRLASLAYDELHRLAQRAMAGQVPGHTLQTTALVNEAWVRLERAGSGFRDRDHFLAVAARAMRSVLVDHARRRRAEKRGAGSARVDLDLVLLAHEERSSDLLALDAALRELRELDATLAELVELRFFAGLKHPEIARVTARSLRSVERDWATARAWLYARVSEAEER